MDWASCLYRGVLRLAALITIVPLSACATDDITGAFWPAPTPATAAVQPALPPVDTRTEGEKLAQNGDVLVMEGRDLIAEGQARVAQGERMAAEGKRIQEEARAGHVSRRGQQARKAN